MGAKLRAVALAVAFAAGLLGSAGPASSQVPPSTPSSSSSPSDNVRIIPFGTSFWWALSALLFGDDPALLAGSARHDPWSQTINGVSATPLPESRTNLISTMIWGGYDVSDHIGLGPNQRLVLGGFYRHDFAWTKFGGFGEQTSDNNAFGVLAVYVLDNWQFSGGVAFDWGNAEITNFPSGNVGNFDTRAHSAALQVGRVFTLWGDAMPPGRTSEGPWPFRIRQMSVYFNPVFRAGYNRARADGFTDNAGVAFGKEIERAWTVGGSFTLSAVLPQNGAGPLWRPYVEFSIDRQLGYRHTIDQPTTGLVAHLDHDKTYWGVSGGLAVWVNRNVSLGGSGFFRASGSQEAAGGLVWVRVNLFGPGGVLRTAIANR
jgi:hypothetical protein